MTIPSVKYMLFLLVVSALFFLLKRYRVLFLLLSSWCFYAICQPSFVFLLALGTTVCYGCAIACERQWLRLKKAWVVLGSIYFLGILFYYKYLAFFSDICFQIAGIEFFKTNSNLLPIGISFYTFTALAYLFDVAEGKTTAEKKYFNCALYLSFFPAILSGPINRANALLPQIRNPGSFSYLGVKKGLLHIVTGTLKKLVVANSLARFVDAVYSAPGTAARGVVLLAVAAYSFQIYYDFSGYTDIALGSAEILGFSLPENFRAPYFAGSIREFWRRWHISLTSWFRDYLYIPLGGSRVNRGRLCLNTLIVFALSGLWHGADWSFVVWGLLNGVFLVLELLFAPIGKSIRTAVGIENRNTVFSSVRVLITFSLISVAWIFFRADSVSMALEVFRYAFGRNQGNEIVFGLHEFTELRPLVLTGICIFISGVIDCIKEKQELVILTTLPKKSLPYWLSLAALALFVAVFGVYGGGYDAGAFIYFQF